MVTISAFADEVFDGFDEQLKFLSENNISHIELRFIDGVNILDVRPEQLTSMKHTLQQYNIRVSAIASPVGKSLVTETFTLEEKRFRRAVELATFFETSMIRVFSFYPPPGEEIKAFRKEVIQRFRMMISFLEGTNLVIIHENEAGIYGHSAGNCREIMENISSPHLRQVYDPGNFVWSESIADNMDSCFPLLKDYIAHVHIKDWRIGKHDSGTYPGEGDAQIDRLIFTLAQMNYNGFLTLESHIDAGGQLGGKTTMEHFQKALKSLRTLCEMNGLKFK